MATALPSTGSLSMQELHLYETDSNGSAFEVSMSMLVTKWSDTYYCSGYASYWDPFSGYAVIDCVCPGNYRAIVDTTVNVSITYGFWNGYDVDLVYAGCNLYNGNAAGFDISYPNCYTFYDFCYIVSGGSTYAVSPGSSGTPSPSYNIGWFRGKLRYNVYTY
jgi:hypothetical protein